VGPRHALVGLVAGLCLTAVVGASQEDVRLAAERMADKFADIAERASHPSPAAHGALRTAFSDDDLNAYLNHYSAVLMPPGLQEPEITVIDRSLVEGKAIINLDAIRTAKPRGWLDPMAYAMGSVTVEVAGYLTAADGQGQFAVARTSLGGVPVSKTILQELVAFYTSTPDNPAGVDLDRPFPLPASVRAIELAPGQATIIQ